MLSKPEIWESSLPFLQMVQNSDEYQHLGYFNRENLI